MMLIKSFLLAGFMLASAYAVADSNAKPAMATLQVQSNFDFSLTRKEFRVHYSGLGEGFTATDSVFIKIVNTDTDEEIHSFPVQDSDRNEKKILHFALDNAEDEKYAVKVCAGQICSDKNPALTDIVPVEKMKITCKRVDFKNGKPQETTKTFEEDFFGPGTQDWIQTQDFATIEGTVNAALTLAQKPADYLTEYSKLGLNANPQYKHKEQIFFAAVTYDIKRFKKLFDKTPTKGAQENTEYADEFCERKYLLSAHAHIVKKSTKEVVKRFKTTLFLSEGGKQMYVLSSDAQSNDRKVHVEMTHKGVQIPEGDYDLWITFCATEKDSIESTFCANPLIKQDFNISHNEQ